MKRICSMLLCILLIVIMTIPVCAVSSVPDPVMKATASVVRVLAEYADGYTTGSGFVIKSDKDETLIATNYHVIEGNPYSISVWLSEDETVSATVLAYTDQKDMCILKLAYPVALAPLSFAENGATQGEAVYAVGFPGAADYLSDKEAHTSSDATITDGIVSAVREATVSKYGTPTKILQINAAINSGNSGGPLFNANGEVVGINTYGINDAQGIFGAIDISELKAFMADHAIPVPNIGKRISWIAIAAAIVVAFVIAVVLIIVMKKKKVIAPVKAEPKNCLLHEYMATYPDGIGINDAVALLLPVALQLRDLHNNGDTHLQVSPNSISVGANGAILCDATSAEADRYTSGYAAPEVYKGSSAGNLTDIYSFCAVLSYVASGKQPINSLSRAENVESEVLEEDIAWAELVKTGMALDPANRFTSMQDIIIKLSPYNVRSFTNTAVTAEPIPETPANTQKAKPTPKKIAIVAAITLVLALLGTYLGCYIGAKICVQNGNFDTAQNLLFVSAVTKLHDKKLVTYIDAGQMMSARQYGQAKATFESLPGYLNANELAQEADYRHALQYADANEYDIAMSIMSQLSNDGYKDAQNKALEIQYRKGVYLLLEKADFETAEEIFRQLVNEKYVGAKGMQDETRYLWALSLAEEEDYVGAYKKLKKISYYADAKDAMAVLEEIIYAEGQNLYHNKEYAEAKIRFGCISTYNESELYLSLIGIRTNSNGLSVIGEVSILLQNFYFEDAAEILLSDQDLAEWFLRGTWRGDGYYLSMDADGYLSYSLPWINYGDYYRIADGTVLKYPKDDYYATKKLFFIKAITPDCIEVFCYKNNRTYTLNRQ